MFKKLNEQLQKFLEGNLNELSYETKKSYLAKRQAQLDKAQANMNRAQRLVRDTEYTKQGKRKLSPEKLSALVDFVKEQIPTFKNRDFYKERWKNGTEFNLEAGNVYEDYSNSCHLNFRTDDKYLYIYIETTDKDGKRDGHQTIKVALDEFTATKLNKKAVSEIKAVLKVKDTKQDKNLPKVEKSIENIKKLLTRFKENIINNKAIPEYAIKTYKRIISIPRIVISNTKDVRNDYQIYAVCLNDNLDVIVLYYSDAHRWDNAKLKSLAVTPTDLLKGCMKIEDALKQLAPASRSNLKSQEKKLAAKKEQAEKAIFEYRDLMRNGHYDKIDAIKENGNNYEFLTHYWGNWEGDDYDFERPTEETKDQIRAICDQLKKKYPDLKFSYGVSEKHMLDCSVSWS